MHPCISDFLAPDIKDNIINTVYPEPVHQEGDWPLTRFIQLPPAINQNARLTASFMNWTGTEQFPFWRETIHDKPESPVFGWIVINYQDLGLQFFRPDGRFYREIRVGGPQGANVGSKWLPFDPPSATDKKQTGDRQLDELIQRLAIPEFLQSFFYMINEAIKTMPYPPSEYAAYANAIVGKPLALVNVGWFLELATPPLTAQNTLGRRPVDEAAELYSYKFPFQIGDASRPFDGVVGYWNTNNEENGITDWDNLYTFFADPDDTSNKVHEINASNYPRLSIINRSP